MSCRVRIDYENIGSQCNSICSIAEKRLAEIDEVLNSIDKNASRLLNNQTKSIRASIQSQKDRLIKELNDVKNMGNQVAKKGTVYVYDDVGGEYRNRNRTIDAANRLLDTVNSMSSCKLIEYRTLIEKMLIESSKENYQRLLDEARKGKVEDSKAQKTIETVSDDMLRQFTYIAHIQDSDLSGDALIEAGKKLMQEALNASYEKKRKEETERIKNELINARVDEKIIKEVTSISGFSDKETIEKMNKRASDEIINENVRQQSIKVIIKAITARGFIVDKKNIRIDREKNVVNFVALKASGERADFKVFLDGKFIYDFHQGYNGQACQKDIEPFMKDLEEVYGIHVKKQEELWSNPDKISTMKYQTYNTNKNKR